MCPLGHATQDEIGQSTYRGITSDANISGIRVRKRKMYLESLSDKTRSESERHIYPMNLPILEKCVGKKVQSLLCCTLNGTGSNSRVKWRNTSFVLEHETSVGHHSFVCFGLLLCALRQHVHGLSVKNSKWDNDQKRNIGTNLLQRHQCSVVSIVFFPFLSYCYCQFHSPSFW